jgi:hypothetical protein
METTISILLTVAKEIKDTVDQVRSNKKKCTTLSNRIQLLCPALHRKVVTFCN